MAKLVSIDWLEVYCLEPVPMDAAFFERHNFPVKRRAYGTPQYREMFTILTPDCNEFDYIEVRRNPYSVKSKGGIMADNACHLRLSNRFCYHPRAVDVFLNFLSYFGYIYKNTSRIDICADFQQFDNGWNPQEFISKYMREELYKEVQPRLSAISSSTKSDAQLFSIAAHGTDKPNVRYWNSLAWGSSKSNVRTKMYNKSQEMKEVHDKPYIREAWQRAGLNPCNGDVYRVEFSIKAATDFVCKETGEMERMTLWRMQTDTARILWFTSLAFRYFHFREVVYTRNGNRQRKDRCPEVRPFDTTGATARVPIALSNVSALDWSTERVRMWLENQIQEMDSFEQSAALEVLEFIKKRYRTNSDYQSAPILEPLANAAQ